MKTNKELLAIAKKQLGNGGAIYRKYTGLKSGQAWCDAFVYWLFNANGCGELLPWKGRARTSCPYSIQWCRKNLAEIPIYLAMPCDIFYMDWDKNGIPNHVGIAEAHDTTASIYTIEGNTSGGKVDDKHRDGKYNCGLFRPHFKPDTTFKDKELVIDGDFGWQSIGGTEKALKILGYYTGAIDMILGQGFVRAIQKLCGAKPDGAWGANTSGSLQTYLKKKGYYKGKIDKQFGKQSVIALQKWANANAYQKKTDESKPTTPVKSATPKADKLLAKIKELAWAESTPEKKWKYSEGSPRDVMKKALKKYGYNTKSKMSDCGNNVNTAVREAGIDKDFVSLHAVKTPFPKQEKMFDIVLDGKAIPDGFLKPADTIRYKKTNNSQHAMFYVGNNKVCDAGLHNRFFHIRKDEKRYAGPKVKKSTIQVLRVKE